MEDRPGSSSVPRERVKTMLLRREQARLTRLHDRRKRMVAVYRNKYQDKVLTGGVNWANATLFAFGGAGVFTLLNGCIPGTTDVTRTGRQIYMKLLRLSYQVTSTAAGAVAPCRVVVLYDKQTNGAAPSTADLFEDTGRFSVSAFDHDNEQRFTILYDDMFMATVDATQRVVHGCIDVPLLTTYNAGTAGTVADIASGSLYLFTVNNSAGNNGQCVLSYSLYYNDA